MSVKELSDAEFEGEVVKSDIPVLVDFWAPWCSPCKSIAPIIDELAKDYAGKVKFVKINTDDHKETATSYNVRGIPTLFFFKSGELKERIVGAVSKAEISKTLDKVLA